MESRGYLFPTSGHVVRRPDEEVEEAIGIVAYVMCGKINIDVRKLISW